MIPIWIPLILNPWAVHKLASSADAMLASYFVMSLGPVYLIEKNQWNISLALVPKTKHSV